MWLQSTLENWQSEFLQLFAMVTLTSFLIFKGSPESKDTDEEQRAQLDRLIREVATLRAVLQTSREDPPRFDRIVAPSQVPAATRAH